MSARSMMLRAIAPVTSESSAASRTTGRPVPTGCGKVKVAAWMVPNGEAIGWTRKLSPTAGSLAISAPTSPVPVGASAIAATAATAMAARPKGAAVPFGRRRNADTPRLRNETRPNAFPKPFRDARSAGMRPDGTQAEPYAPLSLISR
jgi:hypothetical protein